MKVEIGLVLGLVLPLVGVGAVLEERVRLVDFSEEASCAGVSLYKWEGERKAHWRFDGERRSLRLTYTNTCFSTTMPVLDKALVELIKARGAAPERCYVKYRGNAIEGTTDIHFDTTAVYALPLGMRRDGKVNEAVVPVGGDNVKGIPFEPLKLGSIKILGLGSGDIELLEIGVIYRCKPEKLLDATPMDVDEVAIFPKPRFFKAEDKAMPLSMFAVPKASGFGSAYAAEWFEREMCEFYGEKAFAAQGGLPITFATNKKLTEKIAFDGFRLQVGPEGIVVEGREPMGVMNGVRTLAMLVKQYSGDVGPAVVRPLKMVDWPRLKNRMLHQMMSCYNHLNRYEPDDYFARLERFAIDARFNLFSFEMGIDYRYESAPGTGWRSQSWSRKDFTRVVDRLNAAGAKAVPYVQSPGHQELGLFASKKVRPDLREDGSENTFCTRNPETYPFLFGVFKEIAEVCAHNPGYKPETFYAGADEVQWIRNQPYEKRCKLCRDASYADLYAEHLGKIANWGKDNGYRMMICTDMLNDSHNGQNRWKLGDARDRVPKEMGMLHWSTMDYGSIPFWAGRGHENWKVSTGYSDEPTGDELVKGMGLALYTYNFWLSRTRSGHQGGYGLMAMRLMAARGWGEASVYEDEWREKVAKWGNFLMRNWSRKPIPGGGNDFTTVELASVAKTELSPKLNYAKKELAHIPIAIVKGADGKARGVAMGESAAEVKVGKKAASLVFLHGAHLPEANRGKFYNRNDNYHDWPEGAPTGDWTVKYEDGTEATFEVRYGWNVGESAPSNKRQQVFEWFLGDARYAWSDEEGATVYQHEWVNPHPEKKIVSISLGRKSKYLEYVLLALTVRGTAK